MLLPCLALATMALRLSVAQIAGAADRAFVGRVLAIHSARDESGLPSTWITFAVTQPLKGRLGKEVTIKQFGAAEPLSSGSTAFHPPGIPSYEVGDEMVLFLSGESERGFCSPIGLNEGKFSVRRTGTGRAVVVPGVENAGALAQLRTLNNTTTNAAMEMDLNQFIALVQPLMHPHP